jgi:hypothetical protein
MNNVQLLTWCRSYRRLDWISACMFYRAVPLLSLVASNTPHDVVSSSTAYVDCFEFSSVVTSNSKAWKNLFLYRPCWWRVTLLECRFASWRILHYSWNDGNVSSACQVQLWMSTIMNAETVKRLEMSWQTTFLYLASYYLLLKKTSHYYQCSSLASVCDGGSLVQTPSLE